MGAVSPMAGAMTAAGSSRCKAARLGEAVHG
jgi:hypothetical protein